VFSIKPKVERFALVEKKSAIYSCPDGNTSGFGIGDIILWIGVDGQFFRGEDQEKTYAVSKGWARVDSAFGP
jgi:hypothetical protein